MSAAASPSVVRPLPIHSLVPFLECPCCGDTLAAGPGALHCPRRHSFDLAREGHAHLLLGHRPPGQADTPAMVAARTRFLGAGYYDSLTHLLAELAAEAGVPDGGLVLDVGAGTGHHLARVLDRLPAALGLALDISKHAARRAARTHPRQGAVVADATGRLPVRTGAAALALGVFAPRPAAELHRVLDPRGAWLVASPEPGRHLREWIGPLGLLHVDPAKEARLEARLAPWFRRTQRRAVETRLCLSPDALFDLVVMGPNAFHRQAEELRRRIAKLPAPLEGTASFVVSVYRPRWVTGRPPAAPPVRSGSGAGGAARSPSGPR
jgi:23S rRNA (guanine745-N1)-methyltransferase